MTCEKTFHGAANQCWVEHQTLTHIKEALRVTLRWDVPSIGLPRKLSSVTFTLGSFHRSPVVRRFLARASCTACLEAEGYGGILL